MHTLNKKAARHIVSWSSKEDDILREQIRILGTDNWAIIASKFTNKTTRQCRRRWFTYLNSDYKKGGWSAEEDNLLCQAQKIFGNRWTQIAKVVSGRTDNAVKNRFSTLCKRRAKQEALAKETATPYVNLNNKRVAVSQVDTNSNGLPETRVPLKKTRRDVSDMIERPRQEFKETHEQLTPSLEVTGQKVDILRDLETQASTDMIQGIYLEKDNPEIIALMQEAELLSSLALELNIKNSQQTTDNAWKSLHEDLDQSKDIDMIRFRITDMNFQIESFKDPAKDLKSSRECSQESWRASHSFVDSPGSSDYSTGSTLLTHITVDKPEHIASDFYATHQNTGSDPHPNKLGQSDNNNDVEKVAVPCATTDQSGGISSTNIMPPCDDLKADDGKVYDFLSNEFDFPLQVTPLFRSLASGLPSPQFTESEMEFLLKTLDLLPSL
ncbi:Transcription factor MYB88 [Heracleum sosnowskyi]|uniref:Transcription factor MYB88 n=1 Tax=Heracleum sosnowskyi TaxID=360622 RepID=A0AAD8MHR9_9APIA|nr:Transcription factor MYB88 [Heracleum sosnowskyi]